MCSQIVEDGGTELLSKAHSTAFLSKPPLIWAQGVPTITFYCGKVINGHAFMFLKTYFTHMNNNERTVKNTHFWKSVKRDNKPITGINFLRIARGHFL